MTEISKILKQHFEPRCDEDCHAGHFDEDLKRAEAKLQALLQSAVPEKMEQLGWFMPDTGITKGWNACRDTMLNNIGGKK